MNEKEFKTELKQLISLISTHGTNRQCYATSVAFNAAMKYLLESPDKFQSEYGTVGVELIKEFFTKGSEA